MNEEMRLEGMGIAPGVLETIAIQAASAVEGVVSLEGREGLAGLVGKATSRGAEVKLAENGTGLEVSLHVALAYGRPLHDVGRAVQRAVSDALGSMTDQPVTSVDVFVDDIAFTAT